MHKLLYLHKEDVWQNAPTKMTSASRDIFDYFYLAIRNTYINQFADNRKLSLVKKIHNVRVWKFNCLIVINKASKNKNSSYLLPFFVDKELDIPRDIEDSKYDHTVYNNFEDFFNLANHGWEKDIEGKEIAKNLWDIFIQNISLKKLEDQLVFERTTAIELIKKEEIMYSCFLDEINNSDDWLSYSSKKLMEDI